jgi:adenylosuccinate synthase
MSLECLVKDVKTLGVVCNQWGDTGKGKFVDYFAKHWADIVARGTGGANAGHTIKIGDKVYVFHLIPSSIAAAARLVNVIGRGVAFDPRVCLEELDVLDMEGIDYNNLMISRDAKLVLPVHPLLDRLRESNSKKGKIGTTGRGIGPTFSDHVIRVGLSLMDVLNKDYFVKELRRNMEYHYTRLRSYSLRDVNEVLEHEHFLNGTFKYRPSNPLSKMLNFFNISGGRKIFNEEAIVQTYCEDYRERLESLIRDTDTFMRKNYNVKNILLEGAQGALLDVDFGTRPFVTSSNPIAHGLMQGVGLPGKNADLILGIVKAFYMTRVGNGPFPTELGGNESEIWCDEHTRDYEDEYYSNASVNDLDELIQGIAIRRAGDEYGATTKRPRRVGWLDLPLLRHSVALNGNDLVLTKLDVLDGCDSIKVCSHYVYEGPKFYLEGGRSINKGDELNIAVPYSEVLKYCKPVYKEFEGWREKTSDITSYNDMPNELKKAIVYVERETATNVRIASVGPEREQTLVKITA